MPYNAKVFKVFIASPSDVEKERSIIREVLAEWNAIHSETRKVVLLPIGWETHTTPEMGEQPQAIINKQILKDCDLLVGVFWTRIGTATGEYASGTVEEIEEHLKTNKPAMLYFSSALTQLDKVDHQQYSILGNFKGSCRSRGLYETYSEINEFKAKFNRQLQLKLNQEVYFSAISSQTHEERLSIIPAPVLATISDDVKTLLKEIAQDEHGTLMRISMLGGVIFQTNGKSFEAKGNNPRGRAALEAAIDELQSLGLIIDRKGNRESFTVTRDGYEIAASFT